MKVNRDKEKCLCGSSLNFADCCGNNLKLLNNNAVLNKKFQEDFYALFNLFMMITNTNLEVFEVKNQSTFLSNLTQNEYRDLKDLMLENIFSIEYSRKDSKSKLSHNDYLIYRGLKNNYHNTFIALEYVDQKLVLYDESIGLKFLVSGIVSPLSEGIPYTELPTVVDMTLIPLDDKIVYDIFINKSFEILSDKVKEELMEETKDLVVVDSYESFFEHVGEIVYENDIEDEGNVDLKKIVREDLNVNINGYNAKLIRLDNNNIDDYITLWLDVLKSLRGVKSFDYAREILKTFKDNFVHINELETVFDYVPIARVLEINGTPVGFVSGIISFFESGIMFQIGSFGISKKYQRKGYGKIFIELIKKDMSEYKVNYLWLMPQNDEFWLKQGFYSNLDLIKDLYSLSKKDKVLLLKLSDEKVSFNDFLNLFYNNDVENIPYYRDERSFK